MSNWAGNRGSCSSTSNLSAFAQPFAIPQLDPYPNSLPPFYVDSVQPPRFDQGPADSSHGAWPNPCPPNARTDWFPASNPEFDVGTYGYSGLETVNGESTPLLSWNPVDVGGDEKFGRRSDGSRSAVTESDACYSIYASSGVVQGDPSGLATQCNYGRISSPFDANLDKLPRDDQSKSVSLGGTAESSGLWNEQALRYYGKIEDIGGSYCLKRPIAAPLMTETCTNGGASHSDDLLSWEKHGGFISGKHVDASSSLDLPRVFHETHPQAAMPELSSNLGRKQWPYAHIDENVVSNHVSSVNGGNMISESFAAPQMGPPADGFVPGTGEVSLGGHKKGIHSVNEYYAGAMLSSVNEPQSLLTSGSELLLDGTDLGKGVLQCGSFVNGGNSVVKSMPAPTMGYPIDGFRSQTGEASIGDHENGRDCANELYAGILLSNVNKPWSVQAFGSKPQLKGTSLGEGVLQHGSSMNYGDSVAKLLPPTIMGFPNDGFSPRTGEVSIRDHKNSANELYARSILSNVNEPQSVQALGSKPWLDGTTLGKSMSQHDSSGNDGNCDVKPLLAHTMVSPVDGFSSQAAEVSTGDHKDGRDCANERYASILLSSVNKLPFVRACGSESQFDSADVGVQLGRSDFTFEEPYHLEDEYRSNSKSKYAFHHLAGADLGCKDPLTSDQSYLALEHNRTLQCAEKHIGAKSGSRNPHVTLDRFNLPSKGNHALNSAESPSVGLHQFEHAVDSPCWKKAMACSKLGEEPELSGFNLLQDLRIFGNTLYPPKVSSDKPSAGKVLYRGGCSNRGSVSPSVLHAFVNPSGREGGSNDNEDICSSDSRHVLFSNEVEESTGHCMTCQESIGDSKPSHPMQQSSGEGDVTSDKWHMPTHHVSDVGTNGNDSLKMDPPEGLLLSMKHVLESTNAVDNSPGVAKWDREPVIPNIDGQMLVSTMHNLSELLLYSCLSGACDLKERDTDVIQKVIDNLCACSSKNVEQMTPQPKIHNSEEDTCKGLGASPDLDMSESSVNMPPLAGAFSVNIKGQLDNHRAFDKKRQDAGFDSEVESSSELSSCRGNALINKDDAVTEAIKKILSENFQVKDDSQPQIRLFKNLWLEAEATLCSMNYKARFNRMRIEMDNSGSNEVKDSFENNLDAENSSDIGVSVQSNEDDKLLAGTRSCEKLEKLNASVQSLTVVSAINPTTDLLAPSCRPHNSSTKSTPNVEEQGPLKVSPDLSRTAELTAGSSKENGSLAPEISLNSPVTGAICCTDDVQDSVMARLKIPKRWDESLLSENQTLIPPGSVDIGVALKEESFPVARERVIEESTDLSGGKLKMESRAGAEDSQILHFRAKDSPKNPLSAGWQDCSDWEYVLKEEIRGRDFKS